MNLIRSHPRVAALTIAHETDLTIDQAKALTNVCHLIGHISASLRANVSVADDRLYDLSEIAQHVAVGDLSYVLVSLPQFSKTDLITNYFHPFQNVSIGLAIVTTIAADLIFGHCESQSRRDRNRAFELRPNRIGRHELLPKIIGLDLLKTYRYRGWPSQHDGGLAHDDEA